MRFPVPAGPEPPVITFHPSGGVGGSAFYSRLLVGGREIYEFAAPCGTCGLLFDRLGDSDSPLTDGEAAELLGDLDGVPGQASLERLSAPLPRGDYEALVIEGAADLALPHAASDFFVEHAGRLFGDRGDGSPHTAYIWHGGAHVVPKALIWGGERASALVASLICPIQDLRQANEARVQHWIDHYERGGALTALAVSIVDQQSPAVGVADPLYPHREHRVLLSFLLDGHHRALAAARLNAPLRLLAFVSLDNSNADPEVIADTLDRLRDPVK